MAGPETDKGGIKFEQSKSQTQVPWGHGTEGGKARGCYQKKQLAEHEAELSVPQEKKMWSGFVFCNPTTPSGTFMHCNTIAEQS